MQKHGNMLVKIILLSALYSVLFGCGGKPKNYALEREEYGVELRIEDGMERVLIYIINGGDSDIVINSIMRIAGADYEIGFLFDGVVADIEKAPIRGLPEVIEGQEEIMILRQGSIYGAIIEKSDIRSLYDLNEGECKAIRATFKERADGGKGRFNQKLLSNELIICF